MKYIRVKNWERFQHYKTGKNVGKTPPWIKLYTELLNDYEFTGLPENVRYQLIGIWIIASTCDNDIPLDVTWLKQRLDTYRTPQIQLLIDKGWLESYDGPRTILDQSREEKSTVRDSSISSIEEHTEPKGKGAGNHPRNLHDLMMYLFSVHRYVDVKQVKVFMAFYAGEEAVLNADFTATWRMGQGAKGKPLVDWKRAASQWFAKEQAKGTRPKCPACHKQTWNDGHADGCRVQKDIEKWRSE